jgi:hypothetical protein
VLQDKEVEIRSKALWICVLAGEIALGEARMAMRAMGVGCSRLICRASFSFRPRFSLTLSLVRGHITQRER